MSSVELAARLFGVAVSLAGAIVFARGRGWPAAGRAAGALAFLALAVGEGLQGAVLGPGPDPAATAIRVGGYALLLGGAGATWLSRRPARGRGLPYLGAGVALLAVGEALLAEAPEGAALLRGLGYLALAWFVLRVARSSIRVRFAAALVGLLVVVAVVVAATVASVLGEDLRTEALDRVARQAGDAASELEPLAAEEARRLVVVAGGSEAQERFRRERRFSRAEMTALRDSLFPGVRFIVFLSSRGQVLGSVGLPGGEAVEVATVAVVRFSLDEGREAASLDTLVADRLVLLGAAPVRDRDRVIGVAVAGYLVDRNLLERITGSGVLTAVFRRATPVPVAAAGFEEPLGEGPAVDPAVLRDLWEGFLSGEESARRPLAVAGEDTFAALAPLRRADGRAVGVLLVAEPAAPVAATRADIDRLLFVATVLLFGLAFLLAAVVARRITRPVIALTDASRRVAAGDLQTKAPVRGDDEVGELAAAFNQMTASLAAATANLRAAMEEEARLRARLETVIDSMGDGLVAVELDGTVVTVNPAAAEILGRPGAEVVGKPLDGVLEVRDAEGGPVSLDRDLPPGTAFVARPDGRPVAVAIGSAPLRDPGGRTFGRVLVLRDMTREHEVERMKSEFLANVSHELRTPLTPIIGYSELLTDREVEAEQVRQFAESMLTSARRLERIVAMLVDFAAIESGRMTLETEAVAVRSLVAKATEEWRGRSDRHRIVTRFEPRLPRGRIDVSLFRRALDEVIDNALKYSPQGGTITVSVGTDNGRTRRMLRLDVSDQGIGIDPEDLATIFNDFRQVDASDTRSFGGLGLGLAFVKRIIDAHGGSITASSEPGGGSTFTLLIPVADTRDGRS